MLDDIGPHGVESSNCPNFYDYCRCNEVFAEKLKHKCGTHFSSGPVDVGVVSTHNGRMAYSCEKCVEEKAAAKAQEDAQEISRFTKKWMGV